MSAKKFSTMFAGKELIIETGKFANAANGSCTVQYGDTVILATAVISDEVRPGLDYFPLMVDYEEKLYAAGRIKGSRFIKREGRPTDEAVLVARFIDRAIRPLFDDRITNDVQVIVTALAYDGENDPDILGLIGASCALHLSDIPWNGPIGAVRVGRLAEDWVVNPTVTQRLTTSLDLDLAGTHEKIVMIEARSNQASEETVLDGFVLGSKELEPVIKLIEQVRTEAGKTKRDMFTPKNEQAKILLERTAEVKKISHDFLRPLVAELFFGAPKATKHERAEARAEMKKRLSEFLKTSGCTDDEVKVGTGTIYHFTETEVSRMIVQEGKRVDGRGIEEVRPLEIGVGVLPRVHGTGLFSRGETQVLSVCTLGAPGDVQTLDGMELMGLKNYMHHYNFPPYSVGEAKPLRGPSRRDIGHGALAEKALEPVLPSKEIFPYAIRVVSEVFGSNGSSSMASTCGSTLALMDAGVPITAPVAGIAMGLASYGDKWTVLTDLQDLEDGAGGMDFKITGTKQGITAIQMDTKTTGLTHDIIIQTMKQGRAAREMILDRMALIIAAPRPELSEYAPRILTLMINPEKIREVIGPGGKMINEIIAKTGVQAIDIEQNGLVMITSANGPAGQAAYDWVNNLTRDVKAGETFEGAEVVRLMDFGAFVNILPGRDGMVHVSELAPWRVGQVKDIVNVGDKVNVKVIEIDDQGRVNLSMKQAEGNNYTEEMKAKVSTAPAMPPRGARPPRRT